MEFSRWLPVTYWLWRHRAVLACTVLATFLSGVILYKATELAYLYRANKVLAAISTSQPASFSESATLRYFCPNLETHADGTQTRVCSKGDVFHPYLLIAVSQAQSRRELVMEAFLPRKGVEPLHLAVFKDYDREGNMTHVEHRPNDTLPKGVAVYLARNASLELRLKYACALPFVTCTSFADFATHK